MGTEPTSQSRSQSHRWKILGCAVVIFFWLPILFGRFPAPFIDDAFFIGAALNLAQHNTFSNPLCEELASIGSTTYFFAYMPLHSYLLAGWLKLFGISAISIHLFYTGLALGISLLIYRFFPGNAFAPFYALLISLTVFGLLGGTGLRADSLGLLFFLIGLDVGRASSPVRFIIKNFFLALSVITFPNVAFLAMVISLGALLHRILSERSRQRLWLHFVILTGAAYLAAFLLFLWCIDGRLFEFLTQLSRAQEISSQGVLERAHFFTPVGAAKWLAVQIPFLILTAFVLIRCKNDSSHRDLRWIVGAALLGYVVLGFASRSSATGCHLWAFACLMFVLWLIARENWKWRGLIPFLVIFCIAVLGHAHSIVEDCLASRISDSGQKDRLLAQVELLNPDRIYADAYAMREIFDYRLPPNARCYETSSTAGWGMPDRPDLFPKGAVAIVSVNNALFNTTASPHASEHRHWLELGGKPIVGICRNPYDLVLIDNR